MIPFFLRCKRRDIPRFLHAYSNIKGTFLLTSSSTCCHNPNYRVSCTNPHNPQKSICYFFADPTLILNKYKNSLITLKPRVSVNDYGLYLIVRLLHSLIAYSQK